MDFLTENVALQAIVLISAIGTPFGLFIRSLIKRSETRSTFDMKNIFTKEDFEKEKELWRQERKEIREEADRDIAMLREEHKAEIKRRIEEIVRFYEDKIEAIIKTHAIEMEGVMSKMRYMGEQLEQWRRDDDVKRTQDVQHSKEELHTAVDEKLDKLKP